MTAEFSGTDDLKAICVFCGSRNGSSHVYAEAARDLGDAIASAGCDLVYGAGGIGMMGVVADAVAGAGGRVVGIIPRFLDEWEVGRRHSDEFVVTGSMHERKLIMSERADAFVVLPGGLGTLDETFEIITWKQLRLHDKPIVIVNVEGYWNGFVDLVDSMIDQGFVDPRHRELFSVVDSVDAVIPKIRELIAKSHANS